MQIRDHDICILSLNSTDPETVKKVKNAIPNASQIQVSGIREIADVFDQGKAIVGVCASGILIRAVAAELKNKQVDPPVIAVADDASVVVPLLGGHHGANQLARLLAEKLGAFAAVTTASDLKLGFDFEAPPAGLALASDHKDFVAKALQGASISVDDSLGLEGEEGDFLKSIPNQHWAGELKVYVGHRPKPGCLSYVPRTTVVGVGASRSCPTGELAALVDSCLQSANRHRASVVMLASHRLKADEIAVLELSAALGVHATFYESDVLNQHKDRLSQTSEIVFRETGCWGVAEAAALETAGVDNLLLPKHKSAMATCAIAELRPQTVRTDT